ncbi:GNAT family N-acetyltransferase [Psychrobacillus sp.]|uniref:GNAT family N-acetyltransferase n=1 Tax=Psychrobacillus sp. TaxID=1871623 RepID=UPI0028BF21C6|nr:GNAT family N-acetyltransferase [Psychrobacillus sp.]
MLELLQYPQQNNSEQLRQQIITLQCLEWPAAPRQQIETITWPDNDTHKTSYVFVDNNKAIAHIAIVGKTIVQNGIEYKSFGLSEVVTHPEYRGKGIGRKLLKVVADYMEENMPDVSLFTCKPDLVPFYEKGGWHLYGGSCLVGGTRKKPLRSDDLQLVTMMKFHSTKANKNKQDFLHTDIYLELQENKLW